MSRSWVIAFEYGRSGETVLWLNINGVFFFVCVCGGGGGGFGGNELPEFFMTKKKNFLKL